MTGHGEEEDKERPCSLELPERRLDQGRCWSFPPKEQVIEFREMASNYARESLGWTQGNIFS